MDAKDHETAGCDGRDDGDHGLVQDPDDAELETLSLCDLPLYSDEYEYDDFSKDDECRRVCGSPNIDHGDPFEFSSEDLSGSGRRMCMADNIIFCGRLIPYGRDVPSVDGPSDQACGKVGGSQKPKKKKWRFFKWKLSLFRKHRNGNSSNYRNLKSGDKRGSKNEHRPTGLDSLSLDKYRYVPEKCMDKYGFSTGKPLSQSGRVKCRWYVLMFKSARFPVGMELQDMKMRQSRSRSLSSKFHSLDIDDGAGNGNRSEKGNRNWGLWPLLKALSCSSSSQQCTTATAITKKL